MGLRETLNNSNRTEEFAEVADQYQKSNPNDKSVINLQFDAAKDLYYAEKYDKAIVALQNFIISNPKSSSAPEANFLIAESYYILNKKMKH